MGLKEELKSAAAPRKPVRVHVDGLACDMYVRCMTVGERDAWELAGLNSPNGKVPPDFRSRYLASTLCDADGTRLFSDAEWPEIAAMDAGMVCGLFDVAAKHNKLSEADVVELAGELQRQAE